MVCTGCIRWVDNVWYKIFSPWSPISAILTVQHLDQTLLPHSRHNGIPTLFINNTTHWGPYYIGHQSLPCQDDSVFNQSLLPGTECHSVYLRILCVGEKISHVLCGRDKCLLFWLMLYTIDVLYTLYTLYTGHLSSRHCHFLLHQSSGEICFIMTHAMKVEKYFQDF